MPKQPKKFQQLDEAPNLQNYDHNPVQSFGLNLLKGMGFTEQRGIGFNKQNALNQPLVLKSRPKGLGLGAKLQGESIQNYKFNKKDYIVIKSEPHKGMIGIIKKVKNEDKILTIQLGISGTQVKLKFQQVQKLTQQEYKLKKNKILNQTNNQSEQKKKKRLKWILPSIICKVITKTSIYYLKKIIVNQLTGQRQFQSIYVNDNGEKKYLRDLREKDLQTVLPKPGGIVLILDKKFRGKRAKLIERNKEKCQVIVQVLETLEIEKIHQDLVSEYVQI